jgi:hypothetical protein
MREIKKSKYTFPMHLFFFSLFPVLSLYSRNFEQTLPDQIIKPTVFLLFVATFGSLLLGMFTKSIIKSSLIMSVLIFLNFTFYHVYNPALKNLRLNPPFIATIFLTFLVVTIFVIVYYIITIKSNLDVWVRLTNWTSFSLVIVPAIVILISSSNIRQYSRKADNVLAHFEPNPNKQNIIKRDIYYLIFDRYGSSRIYKQYYDFDNSNVEDYLENNGFYIAKGAHSNYLKTAHSLASSLNMDYINDLAEIYGDDYSSWNPLYFKLQNYAVQGYLDNLGYKTIHFGSWWAYTSHDNYSDVNVNISAMSEFETSLYKTSAAYIIGQYFGLYNKNKTQWERVRYQMEKLKEIPNDPESTFVFAHFILPHPPFVFDANGNFVNYDDENFKLDDKYLEQLKYTNTLIKELVRDLLSAQGPKPIIVIQSDEGPYPDRYASDLYGFNWTKATPEEIDEKTGILNAYYLPNIDVSGLYPTISPVNSFRFIFDNYFGTNLGLILDKHYVYESYDKPYKFSDVTDVINSFEN